MSIFLCLVLIFFTSCSYIDTSEVKEILPSEMITPVVKSYDKSIGTTYNLFYERAVSEKKFEPSKGILEGAYILASKNIDYDITTFESRVDHSFNQYVYNFTLGKKFDDSFILKCIARQKTPYIVINPDLSDKYNLDNLEKFSKEVGYFNTDVFIELYPEPSSATHYSENYKSFFQDSYNILNKNIKNVSIIYTPNTEELSDMESFHPGLKYVDWIGYKYIGTINPNEENIYPDFFSKLDYIYKTYEDKNPIIVSMYTLSHYSKINHRYYEDEFFKELNSVRTKIINEYPRVKGFNYYDINGTLIGKQYANDNYSISEDINIAKKYGKLLNEFTSSSAIEVQLIKAYDTAYKIEDNIYFSKETLVEKFNVGEIIIKGYDHVIIDGEKHYSSKDLKKMNTNINLHVDEETKRIIIK